MGKVGCGIWETRVGGRKKYLLADAENGVDHNLGEEIGELGVHLGAQAARRMGRGWGGVGVGGRGRLGV